MGEEEEGGSGRGRVKRGRWEEWEVWEMGKR